MSYVDHAGNCQHILDTRRRMVTDMDTCPCCGQGNIDQSLGMHLECDDEWLRRENDGICVRCGEKPIADPDTARCNTCDAGAQHKNYPGS